MILLLVEDEKYTRDGIIKFIDWTDLGVEKVYTAEDGLEAIDVASVCSPDIVLADIRMPRMNGLDMAKKIREISPHCALIFMSGYSDTDYFKSAIHLSALDYVSKPLDLNELNTTLIKAVGHVKQVSEKEAFVTSLKHHELATMLIQDEVLNDELIQLWRQNGLPWDQNILLRTLLVKQEYSRATTILIKEIARQLDIQVLIGRIDTFYLLHVVMSPERDYLLEGFTDGLLKHLTSGDKTIIAIGMPVYHPLEIKKSFTSARAVCSRRFYHPDRQLFMDGEWAPSLDIVYNPTHEFRRLLLKSPNEARQWVIDQYEHIRHYDGTPVELVQNWAFQMGTELYIFDLNRGNNMLNGTMDEATLWNTIVSLTSLDQVKEFLLDGIDGFLNCYSGSEPNLPSVLGAQRFIHLNYADPLLTLETVSHHVNLSPTYLCSIFKEATNQTINQYLTNCRIHRAQLLLKTTNMHIYEVAQASGYSDSSYFIKIFRKSTGITPQEYRKRHLII